MPTLHANGIDIHSHVEWNGPWVVLSHALTTDLTLRDIPDAIPGTRLEVIPSASHLSCIEQEETFNGLVANFLAD